VLLNVYCMKNIALVDDHILLRKGLAALVNSFEGFNASMEAGNGRELISRLPVMVPPDIVLLDISMPVMDGLETARWLKHHYPAIKVMALSMISNEPLIIRMLKNGIRGFMLKDCEPRELQRALLEVAANGYYYNDLLTARMRSRTEKDRKEKPMINEKELVFLQAICSEKTYKQIAQEMQVSERTVDGYRDALFQKLDLNTRVGLALYAIKQGIVVI
jgi:two-component system invasion response regulator UvrY